MSVRTERRGAVALVVIDRPERRNALDAASCEDLLDALGRVATARAVVLAGEGGNFCAGADVSDIPSERFLAALHRLLEAIGELPVPVIAAVEGVALGAGLQLAVACDLRVAAPDSRFGVPAARLGVVIDHASVQRVVQLAGAGPARAMLLAAEEIDGAAAVGLGLAQRVGRRAEALAWADEIAGLAPLSVRAHKLALNRLDEPPADAEVDEARRRAWASTDLAEGVAAFSQRRRPRFEGR